MLFYVISCCSLWQWCVLYSRVGLVILGTAESAMPWVYCYLPMNHIEESLSLLHFWIWERYLIFLIMPCCCNVFINWVFIVLKFNGSPPWSCPASKVQSLSLWLVPVLEGISQGSALGPLLFLIYVNDMLIQIQNGSLLQFANNA